MNNNDTITLTGLVATEPRQTGASGNFPVVGFRLLSFQSHFDRAKDAWVDDDPNWYSVSAFRQLAVNVLTSVGKGDRVLVTGRLRIRNWEASGRTGTSIDLNADSIGHDLCWGRTSYSTVAKRDPAPEDERVELVPAPEPVTAGEQSDELAVPF